MAITIATKSTNLIEPPRRPTKTCKALRVFLSGLGRFSNSLLTEIIIWNQPKCTIIREKPQTYPTFASSLIPPKWIPFFMTPAKKKHLDVLLCIFFKSAPPFGNKILNKRRPVSTCSWAKPSYGPLDPPSWWGIPNQICWGRSWQPQEKY